MYTIGQSVYGYDHKVLKQWLGNDLYELAKEIEIVEEPYSGDCEETAYLGVKFGVLDETETVYVDELFDGFDQQEADTSLDEMIKRMLDAFLEDDDIDHSEYDRLLNIKPKAQRIICWSTS